MIARNISFKERTIFGRTLFYDIVHLHYSYKRTKKLRVREMLIPTFLFIYNKPIKLKDSKMKKVRQKLCILPGIWKLLPFTFALPFGQRFSIPLRAGDRWFRACGAYLRNLNSSFLYCFQESSTRFSLVSSNSGFPPAKVLWQLILALQKDPLTEGGGL